VIVQDKLIRQLFPSDLIGDADSADSHSVYCSQGFLLIKFPLNTVLRTLVRTEVLESCSGSIARIIANR
jgi:hypothetical protein